MAIYVISWVKRIKGSFFGSVLTISMGIAIGQAIAIAVSPIITRLYPPGDFGIFEVYGSLLAIFGEAVCLKYEGSILLPESDLTAANAFGLCMMILVIMSGLTGIVTWLWSDNVLPLVKAQALQPYIWLLPVGVLGAGIYQVLNFWAIRQKAFGAIAWTKISQNAGKAAAMIGLGSMGLGPVGLLAGAIVGHCSGSTRLAVSAWRKDKDSFRLINVKQWLEVLRRYKKFPLFTLGAQLLNTLGKRAPYLLLAATYGLKVVGWFALAQWIIGTPISLIGASVAQVYMGELTHLNRQSVAGMKKLFFKTIKMLALIALVTVPLIFIATLLIPLVFGRQWGETAVYIRILSFMYAFEIISYPLSGTVDYLERQGLGLMRESLRSILMVGAIPLAVALKQPPVIAILFYGAASAIVYSIGLLLSWYAIKVHENRALATRSATLE